MCSIRNAPMGITPNRECSLRQRNDVPWPARSGGTPRLTEDAAGCSAVAMNVSAPQKDFKRRLYQIKVRRISDLFPFALLELRVPTVKAVRPRLFANARILE